MTTRIDTRVVARHCAAFASSALCALAALPAQASPYNFQFDGYHTAPPQSVSFASSTPAVSGTFNAGASNFTATDLAAPFTVESLIAYCVEITQPLGSIVNNYVPVALSASGLSAAQQTAIGQLYSHGTNYAGSLVAAGASAAFQLALWEIVNETSGSFDLANGSFRDLTGGTIGATAAGMLSTLAATAIDPNLQFTIWSSPTHQNFLQVTTRSTHVPEPSTLALLGMGLAAAALRRRRNG